MRWKSIAWQPCVVPLRTAAVTREPVKITRMVQENQNSQVVRDLLYCPDAPKCGIYWGGFGLRVSRRVLLCNAFGASRTDKGERTLSRLRTAKNTLMPTRILIADDDSTIRLLLRRLLEKQPDWQVCGEASNGVEAIERVEELEPDVVVMDLGMPVMTGLQAAPEIMKAHPQLPMLLISVQEVSRQLAREARNAGYRGAVTKSCGSEVLKGIEALLRHETFFYAEDGFAAPAQESSF
jgi:CheY-like chemotaxis protein